MKISIWFTQYNGPIDESRISFLSNDEHQKIITIQNNHSRRNSLLARFLIYSFLLKKYKTNMPLALTYGRNGKPSLSNFADSISISHCKNLVAVAFADKNIGLDVEEKVKTNSVFLNKLFTEAEMQKILEEPSNFLRLWTLKEACVKHFGLTLLPNFKKIICAPTFVHYKDYALHYLQGNISNATYSVVCAHAITEIEWHECVDLPF